MAQLSLKGVDRGEDQRSAGVVRRPVEGLARILVGNRTLAEKIKAQDVDCDPLCRHCEKKLDTIHWRKIKAFFNDEYLIICPKSRKVIGTDDAR